MILSTRTHPCMLVFVCALVWFVCLGRLKHYISHTHSHPQTETDKYTRSCTHCATFAIQHSVSQEYTHMHTKTTTHTHTQYFHCWRIGRFLQAAGKNVWTNLRRTHVHTTEHFQPTMLTLYSFPEPFYLQAGQVKQRFSIEQYREARLEDCQWCQSRAGLN